MSQAEGNIHLISPPIPGERERGAGAVSLSQAEGNIHLISPPKTQMKYDLRISLDNPHGPGDRNCGVLPNLSMYLSKLPRRQQPCAWHLLGRVGECSG